MNPDIRAHIGLPTVESQVSHEGGLDVSRTLSEVSGTVPKHSSLMILELVFRVPMKGHSSTRYTSNWNSCHFQAKGLEFLFEEMRVMCVSNRAFYMLKLGILEKQTLYWWVTGDFQSNRSTPWDTHESLEPTKCTISQ